ncbi:hypothetical protein SESBI_04887 [Sesbania bispinosa]|nr:hypothetical protein SESBI_04887 [Sesbania bispinosa]
MTNITRYSSIPRKVISVGHFIKQFPSLFKSAKFGIATYHGIPRAQIPPTHFIKQYLGIHKATTFGIHIKHTIRKENPSKKIRLSNKRLQSRTINLSFQTVYMMPQVHCIDEIFLRIKLIHQQTPGSPKKLCHINSNSLIGSYMNIIWQKLVKDITQNNPQPKYSPPIPTIFNQYFSSNQGFFHTSSGSNHNTDCSSSGGTN